MQLSIMRIFALLFGLIVFTSSTVPTSRTPQTNTTSKQQVSKKDRKSKTYKLQKKANKHQKVKRQNQEKSIKSLTWFSLFSSLMGFGLAFASAWLWGTPALASILLIASFLFTITTITLSVLNFSKAKDRKLSTGDWMITIFALLIASFMISGFAASILY